MSLTGTWPRTDDKDGRVSNFISFVAGMNAILFITLPQTAFLFEIWPDLNLMSESLSMANFPVTVAVVKLYTFCKNRQGIKNNYNIKFILLFFFKNTLFHFNLKHNLKLKLKSLKFFHQKMEANSIS